MAIIDAVKERTQGSGYVVAWEGMDVSDTGEPFSQYQAADRSVQVQGTFDGTAVVIEGSNSADASVWFTLTDPQGNALSFSSAGGKAISEAVRHVRPRLSGGTSPDIDVYLFAQGRR